MTEGVFRQFQWLLADLSLSSITNQNQTDMVTNGIMAVGTRWIDRKIEMDGDGKIDTQIEAVRGVRALSELDQFLKCGIHDS